MLKRILNLIFTILILFSVYHLYLESTQEKKETNEYNEIKKIAIKNEIQPLKIVDDFSITNNKSETIIDNHFNIDYDWDKLSYLNSDIKGWLFIPNTEIDLPVVQTTNNSYYLKHSFSKKYNKAGCLFFDYKVSPDTQNKVIHGHNMGTNKKNMFSTLINYDNEEYYNNHKNVFFTPYKQDTLEFEVIAVIHFNIKDIESFDYLKQTFTPEEFNNWYTNINKYNIYTTPEDITYRDTFLTLSTCDTRFDGNNGRYIIILKLVK